MTPGLTSTAHAPGDAWAPRFHAGASAHAVRYSSTPPVSLRDVFSSSLQGGDSYTKIAPSWLRLVEPWYEEQGMEGMKAAFEAVMDEAMRLDARIELTPPVVTRIRDDDMVETVFASSSILVPADMDRMAFRDLYFDRIAAVLRPEDLGRLALGVRPLERAD